MELPVALLLDRIKTRNIHCDEKSEEKLTGVTKRKYKLAGNILPPINIYNFFVLTSNKDTCQNYLTLEVKNEEWENKDTKYLKAGSSYIDIKRVEPLTKEDLLKKIKDPFNRFYPVAILPENKFHDLKILLNRLPTSHSFISDETKTVIVQALEETNTIDSTLKKLGLIQ
jgi:hypothetical protein